MTHELGHYLVHRVRYPDGFQCGEQDVVRWDSEYGRLERQFNSSPFSEHRYGPRFVNRNRFGWSDRALASSSVWREVASSERERPKKKSSGARTRVTRSIPASTPYRLGRSDLRDPCQLSAYLCPKAEDENRRKGVLQRARQRSG